MGAKLVAGIVGLIILVVLVQTLRPRRRRLDAVGQSTGFDPDRDASGKPGRARGTGPGQRRDRRQRQTPAGASGSTYTVQSGDTLGAIASRFNVAADQQAAWIADVLRLNDMQDARQLQAGQVLKLPASSGSTRASATPRTSATARPSGTATSAPPSLRQRARFQRRHPARRRLVRHLHRRLRRHAVPDR